MCPPSEVGGVLDMHQIEVFVIPVITGADSDDMCFLGSSGNAGSQCFCVGISLADAQWLGVRVFDGVVLIREPYAISFSLDDTDWSRSISTGFEYIITCREIVHGDETCTDGEVLVHGCDRDLGIAIVFE